MARTRIVILGSLVTGFLAAATQPLGAQATDETPPRAADASVAAPAELQAAELASIAGAARRGVAWMLARQSAEGAFAPGAESPVCAVGVTAMAVWALAEIDLPPAATAGEHPPPSAELAPALSRAIDWLLEFRQPDGGLYDPRRGLAVYTSGIAARALHAYRTRWPNARAEVVAARDSAELFAYRGSAPESMLDIAPGTTRALDHSQDAARELLAKRARTADETRRALEFLAGLARPGAPRGPGRTRVPGWQAASGAEPLGYDDLLTAAYEVLRPEHQRTRRAIEALERYYTLERNPDLTRRYGDAGFERGTQGVYYYYFIAAKTLATVGPRVRLRSGDARPWCRELAAKLGELQKPDGSWVNTDEHWWEGEPILVTAYALLALDICATVGAPPSPK